MDFSPSFLLIAACFGLLDTSSRSACLLLTCLHPCVSILLALFCSTPRVALLVVDLSLSQSFLFCFAEHFEYSFSRYSFVCLNFSCFVLIDSFCSLLTFVSASRVLFKNPSGLTFFGPIFVSFSPLCQPNFFLCCFIHPGFGSVDVFLKFHFAVLVF